MHSKILLASSECFMLMSLSPFDWIDIIPQLTKDDTNGDYVFLMHYGGGKAPHRSERHHVVGDGKADRMFLKCPKDCSEFVAKYFMATHAKSTRVVFPYFLYPLCQLSGSLSFLWQSCPWNHSFVINKMVVYSPFVFPALLGVLICQKLLNSNTAWCSCRSSFFLDRSALEVLTFSDGRGWHIDK